jgi:predicted nucleotidyltransferase
MKLFLNENSNIENYSVPSTKQPIDEIDDIANSISDNISKEIKIPSDVLNSFAVKPELNKQIWQNDKLNSNVRTKLIKIADDFFKELNLPSEVKMKDIIFTGSLANFNWSEYSDIDLHIVLDFSQIEAEDKFKEDFFYAQKALWNQAHDITVFKYPVELYVQDIKAKLVASAVYSVKKDKWVLQAKREEFKVNKKVIKQKADRFIDNLKDIRNDYKENKLQSVVDKVQKLKDKIKNYRTSGLEKGGEYAIENLVFKTLRRTPFMDILDSYKAKAYDKLMSVKETIKESLRLIPEANDRYATKRDYYTTLFKVTKAKQLYGNDPYFENVQDGQWVGAVIVNIYGRVSKVSTYTAPAGQVRANDLGMRGENPHYMEFKIMAGRGIEHPDTTSPNIQPARTRGGLGSDEFEEEVEFTMELPQGVSLENGATSISFGLPKPGSPASDAHIKAYLIYGDLILDFVENNLKDKIGYVDGNAADIAQQKTADKNQYKFGKLDKEKEMAANVEKDRNLVDPNKLSGEELRQQRLAAAAKKKEERTKRGL